MIFDKVLLDTGMTLNKWSIIEGLRDSEFKDVSQEFIERSMKTSTSLDSFYIVDETILLSKTNQLTNDKYCSLSRTCRYANLTVSAPLSAWGDKVQSQILKRGEIRKKWVLGGI